MLRHFSAALLLLALGAAGTACTSESERKADNTGRNERERGRAANADQAVESKGDLDLTQEIRQAVVAEDTLSVNAKNVKIIVQDQVVTLRGPVASAEERTMVATIAERTAGTRQVVNELEIAP